MGDAIYHAIAIVSAIVLLVLVARTRRQGTSKVNPEQPGSEIGAFVGEFFAGLGALVALTLFLGVVLTMGMICLKVVTWAWS